MAYGYEKGFIIENINRNDAKRKRVNCKDCINYVRSDHSCMKRPLYMPVDGYSNWKNCQHFCLSDMTSNYGLKKEAVRKQQREKEFVGNRPQKTVPKKKTAKRIDSMTKCHTQKFEEVSAYVNKEKVGFNFWDIQSEYVTLFAQSAKGDTNAKNMLKQMLPLELYEGYVSAVKGNGNLYLKAICAYMKKLGLKPSEYACKKFAKETYPVLGELLVNSKAAFTQELFETWFIDFFTDLIQSKKVFEKHKLV